MLQFLLGRHAGISWINWVIPTKILNSGCMSIWGWAAIVIIIVWYLVVQLHVYICCSMLNVDMHWAEAYSCSKSVHWASWFEFPAKFVLISLKRDESQLYNTASWPRSSAGTNVLCGVPYMNLSCYYIVQLKLSNFILL